MGLCASATGKGRSRSISAPILSANPHQPRNEPKDGGPSAREHRSSGTAGPEEARLKLGITKFNLDPRAGVKYLRESGLVGPSPDDLAAFLVTPRLFGGHSALKTGLSPQAVSRLLGRAGRTDAEREFQAALLRDVFARLSFSGMSVGDGIRHFSKFFTMTNDSQETERILQAFANRFSADSNPPLSPRAVHQVALVILFVNKSLHDAKASRVAPRFGFDIFMEAIYENSECASIPTTYLRTEYESVERAPIVGCEESPIAFFNPSRSGWLLKRCTGRRGWVRRFFLLNDHCLFYFSREEDKGTAKPRCIVPLEDCKIEAEGTDCFSIRPARDSGTIKAAKRDASGAIIMGRHSAYVLRAASARDRDDWVRVLKREVAQSPMFAYLESKRKQLRNRRSPPASKHPPKDDAVPDHPPLQRPGSVLLGTDGLHRIYGPAAGNESAASASEAVGADGDDGPSAPDDDQLNHGAGSGAAAETGSDALSQASRPRRPRKSPRREKAGSLRRSLSSPDTAPAPGDALSPALRSAGSLLLKRRPSARREAADDGSASVGGGSAHGALSEDGEGAAGVARERSTARGDGADRDRSGRLVEAGSRVSMGGTPTYMARLVDVGVEVGVGVDPGADESDDGEDVAEAVRRDRGAADGSAVSPLLAAASPPRRGQAGGSSHSTPRRRSAVSASRRSAGALEPTVQVSLTALLDGAVADDPRWESVPTWEGLPPAAAAGAVDGAEGGGSVAGRSSSPFSASGASSDSFETCEEA